MTKRKPPPEFVVPTTITVADESALVAMIEHPAEPTQALVDLFTNTIVHRVARAPDPVKDYLSEYSVDGSRNTMLHALRSALAILKGVDPRGPDRPDLDDVRRFPWHLFDRAKFMIFLGVLKKHYEPATANRILTAVKGVLKQCRRLRLMDADTLADITDAKPIKNDAEIAGRYLERDVRERLAAACGTDEIGLRNRAILATLYATGARRDEISKLDVEHWNRRDGRLQLHGKGDKRRIIPVSDELAAILAEFCGDRTGPIFCRANRNRELMPQNRITGAGIFSLIDQLAKDAGVGAVTPHDFRRTFVSDLIDLGVDMKTISDLVGHADVNTTSGYSRLGERVAREAVAKLVLRGA